MQWRQWLKAKRGRLKKNDILSAITAKWDESEKTSGFIINALSRGWKLS
jgi:hypothetical protein